MAEPARRSWYCGHCLTTFLGDLDSCPNLACREARPGEGWGSLHEAGEIIDRHYRVVRRLATGGAGITYLAREIGSDGAETGPEVAVKVLWASRDHGSYLRRLSQEAQILQELDHPHIVVYRGFVHRTGESPYLVTRFEHGGSLHEYVQRRGLLGLREAAGIVRQMLEALDRAHQVGVIHRDLKPENVLIEAVPEPGEVPLVRVADFGIAKIATSFGDTLTRAGAFIGTPQYAAPEQFDGLPPSPATDVFAAGAVLWFCLQGQPLMAMASRLDPEDAREILIQRLPARLHRPDGPPALVLALEEVLAAAMAVRPEGRCTVREMAAMLQSIETGTAFPRPGAPTGSDQGATTLPLEMSEPGDAPQPARRTGPIVPSGHASTGQARDGPAGARFRVRPPRRRGRLLALSAILALIGLACAGVAVYAVGRFRPDRPGDRALQLPALLRASTRAATSEGVIGVDAAATADWRAIQASVPAAAVAAACGLRGPVDVDIVVEPTGRVRQATPVQVLAPAMAACVTSRLAAAPLARTRAIPVALRVQVGP